ncbi:MAG: 50S ribosomal protein L29 [Rhodospirillales bacterium]|nr:50S ribosomal protein L29 [Rhodospirillales bacterium]
MSLRIPEVRQKTDDELATMLDERARERLNLRFRQATGELENTARAREARREIARIKTVLNERAKGS